MHAVVRDSGFAPAAMGGYWWDVGWVWRDLRKFEDPCGRMEKGRGRQEQKQRDEL